MSSVSISSFRYPSYDNIIKFFECKYRIVANPDRYIQVEVLDAFLDLSYDVLFIGNHLVVTQATDTKNDVVISDGNVLEISFRSFEWRSWNRFLLNVSEFEYPGENFLFIYFFIKITDLQSNVHKQNKIASDVTEVKA